MGDICKIPESTELKILKYLEERFMQGQIYTDASEILIALNPYQNIQALYGSILMRKISLEAAPHIYRTAQRALHALKMSGSQSIIISGVTGSGKTESAKRIIEFLCETSVFNVDIAEQILVSNTILESFGNAETLGNQNSSRFCKFIQLNYDENSKMIGAQIQQYLLEVNRISDLKEKKFHVFYALIHGGPDDILKYIPNHVSKLNANLLTDPVHSFEKLDTALTNFGFDTVKRSFIYKILAGILLLEDLTFEPEDTKNNDKCYVSKLSTQSLMNAAELFGIDACMLENTVLSRDINIKDTTIKISLDIKGAEKARDSMTRVLFYELFKQILAGMNRTISSTSSEAYIGILDIAGHESKKDVPNSFDQLCINYVNEHVQQFFIQRILQREKEWYDKEKIDVPFVPFLDNHGIIDIFDNKSKGLFAFLDQECILKKPSVDNFTKNLLWTLSGSRMKNVNEFIIDHFSGAATYSTADFVEKNSMQISTNIYSTVCAVLKSLTEVDIEFATNKSKSFSLNMRNELNGLMKSLRKSNSQFLRCIKPNNERLPKKFDNVLVMQQVKSGNLIAYAEFMQLGYPLHVSFDSLSSKYKQYIPDTVSDCNEMKQFYTKLMLSIGFKLRDFRFGENLIFFRSQSSKLIDQLMSSSSESIKIMKRYTARSKIRVVALCLIFLRGVAESRKHGESLDHNKQSVGKTVELKIDEISTAYPIPDEKIRNHNDKNLGNKTGSERQSEHRNASKHGDRNVVPTIASNASKKSTRSTKENRPRNCVRYDGKNHLPGYDANEYATRCKNENCKYKTNVTCTKCGVHLCFTRLRNCFENFHILELNESD